MWVEWLTLVFGGGCFSMSCVLFVLMVALRSVVVVDAD